MSTRAAMRPNMGYHYSPGPRYPRFGMPPPSAGGPASSGPMASATMPGTTELQPDFDGKRPRKSVMRKTVDYNSAFQLMIESRVFQRRDIRGDRPSLQPDVMYYPELQPPISYLDNPVNAVTTRFVKTATNKMRCPIFTLAWTPEGRRLITGASSGEFTLWNGLTFNFETILQAHDSPVRSMVWSHNDTWMVTGDHGGYIKYWQSNMNNVKMFQAHKEPVRCVTFSPTDSKFATCSDDGTVRVWDFFTCAEERVMRGHGADVKCVDWHPTKGLLASGSKDNQQPIKIWEPRTGAVLFTLHAHKSTVMDIEWNRNGNWLLTASRDHLLKLFDIRNTKEEVQTFRGHKKEASTLAWHPIHEDVFASGGSDGSIMFWNVGAEKEVGAIEQAHESIVWALDWHPIGHILCSGSNDHTCKFWTRNRPGDTMRDKYNLNTLPSGQEDDVAMSGEASSSHGGGAAHSHHAAAIPGMAPEDRVETSGFNIPGLDSDLSGHGGHGEMDTDFMGNEKKKTPFSKPIPRNFQDSWNQEQILTGGGGGAPPPLPPPSQEWISLQELQRQATAVVAFGSVYPVLPGSNLQSAIAAGERAVKEVLRHEFMVG